MAENHRHSAANSPSVNSYLVGARSNAGSVSGGTPRTVSGKSTILVCSDTSSRSPPIIGPHRQRPQSPNPTPACAVDFGARYRLPRCGTREGRLFVNYLSIRDRYSAPAKFILRILSRAYAKSIEPTADIRLFCQPCLIGNSGRKATICRTFSLLPRRVGSLKQRWLTHRAVSASECRDAQRALPA